MANPFSGLGRGSADESGMRRRPLDPQASDPRNLSDSPAGAGKPVGLSPVSPVEPSLTVVDEHDDHGNAVSERESSADAASRLDYVSLGESTLDARNVAEEQRDVWRREIATLGGVSPLIHFVDSPRTRIDITAAHPGGLPRLLSGQGTTLALLFREDFALRTARATASSIAARDTELSSTRGIDAVHLAVGICSWTHNGKQYCGPVLLRPMSIRRVGHDYELQLRGPARLNLQLAFMLEKQFGVALDPVAFVQLANANDTFTPQPVMDRLAGLLGHVPGFVVETRLVVSSFAEVAGPMLYDAARLAHPVLDSLAGNDNARLELVEKQVTVTVASQDERPPATDTLLMDADAEQEQVIANIVAGNSLVVHTLPGTGATQTVINAIGGLVAANKRVLVVGSRRSRLDEIAYRTKDIGIAGLAVRPSQLRRDLLAAIVRNEKASLPDVTQIDKALPRLRRVLLNYRDALGNTDPVLGVSVVDALERLSELAQLPNPPQTTARIPRHAVEVLASTRGEAAASLIQAAELGEFKYGPEDSPWYGIEFESAEAAEHAQSLARRMHEEQLPALLMRASDVINQTAMRSYESVAELGIYIQLLSDIRETLDKFVPEVFDRPLTELIAATASRRGGDMRGSNRRRLRKLAHEFVRPGAHVGDMHTALQRIQDQRVKWQRFVITGAPPSVPVGIAELRTLYTEVYDNLTALDVVLQGGSIAPNLTMAPLGELSSRIAGLAAKSEVLANLKERNLLLAELRELNLTGLLDDLSSRHVPHDQVANELELAWWQSVLEGILGENKALLSANTTMLDQLERDFRVVDEAHADANAPLLASRLSEVWKIGLVDFPEEADRLKHALRQDRVSVGTLFRLAPRLANALAPVWMCSPYEVHELPDDTLFDTVILLDSGTTTTAENVGAIRRASSVVAFGDPVTQAPTPFATSMAALDNGGPELKFSTGIVAANAQMSPHSALSDLSDILPTITLTRSYRAGGEDLTNVINRRFYGERIEFLPWAGTFLGHQALTAHHVRMATGTPDPATGLIETTDAEIDQVVKLVANHALRRSNESLMVITASMKHALSIELAVERVFAERPDLDEWLSRESSEPFTVLTLDQASAVSRDRVIFSLGFGRSSTGRIVPDFGSLSRFGGDRLLAVAMTRARRSIDVVTSFTADELDYDRLAFGAKSLVDIMLAAHPPRFDENIENAEPMLIDLAERLRERGLHVALTHGGEIALAVSFGDRALAVESDVVLARGTLRESLRLRPQLLRRLGWHYLRVHSFELFIDPESVAHRIAEVLGAAPIEVPGVGSFPVTGAIARVER